MTSPWPWLLQTHLWWLFPSAPWSFRTKALGYEASPEASHSLPAALDLVAWLVRLLPAFLGPVYSPARPDPAVGSDLRTGRAWGKMRKLCDWTRTQAPREHRGATCTWLCGFCHSRSSRNLCAADPRVVWESPRFRASPGPHPFACALASARMTCYLLWFETRGHLKTPVNVTQGTDTVRQPVFLIPPARFGGPHGPSPLWRKLIIASL